MSYFLFLITQKVPNLFFLLLWKKHCLTDLSCSDVAAVNNVFIGGYHTDDQNTSTHAEI